MVLIKKYRVNDMVEAEKCIERDLGKDAIVLTVREIKGKGLKRLFIKKKLEVTAATDKEDHLDDNLVKLQKLLSKDDKDLHV